MLAIEVVQPLRSDLDAVILPNPRYSSLQCEPAPPLQRVPGKQLLLEGCQLLARVWTTVACSPALEALAALDVPAQSHVARHNRHV